MKKISIVILVVMLICSSFVLSSCDWESGTRADTQKTIAAANTLQTNQPTPTDIEYSLERYNLIRRCYWVSGQKEKANALVCPVEKPLGYIVLFAGNTIVGSFIVDGKVTCLNSYLTPDTEYPSWDSTTNSWLSDCEGSYGENSDGVFFFTPDGKYIEWSGDYLYSDIPMSVDAPVVHYEVDSNE